MEDDIDHKRLGKAYVRLAEEAKKLKDIDAPKSEPEKPRGRPKKKPPAEQLSLF